MFFLFISLEDNARHAIWNMHVVSISDLSEYDFFKIKISRMKQIHFHL